MRKLPGPFAIHRSIGCALLLGLLGPSGASAKPAESGPDLLRHFECARCHEGLPGPAVSEEKHCVRCHQSILRGTFAADKATLGEWQGHLHSLNAVPSLVAIGNRLRRTWVESFLLHPHDIRPSLPATMPRLAVTEKQARQLAETLVRSERLLAPKGDAANGRTLFGQLGCAACHCFSGADTPKAATYPLRLSAENLRRAVSLAPDLRFTRDRYQPGALVDWLMSPEKQKPDALMPSFPLTQAAAADLATYLLTTPLAPMPAVSAPVRLPLLARKVTFDEVNAQVFRKTCWHCHSTAAYAKGDGGPGNTGGFGFRGRGFSVTSYADVASGSIDDQGERQSVFVRLPDGTPRLVAILLARQKESVGTETPGLRGMPLGLPPLSPQQLQLVESWIAQGRPQ